MTGPSQRPRITIVNDSDEFLELAELLLEDQGPFQTTTLRASETSVEGVAATLPELVVVDVGSQRSAELGRALVTDRSGSLAGVPVILTTPAGEVSRELLSRAGPGVHHLPKPFTAQALEELVKVLMRRR